MAGDDQSSRDLYRVLDVARTASANEIASAYRRLVRELHPDTRHGAEGPAEVARLGDVLAAYAVLGRPDRRAAYDDQRQRAVRSPRRGGGVPIAVHYRPTGPPRTSTAPLWAGPVHVHGAPGAFSPAPRSSRPEVVVVFDELVVAMEHSLSCPWVMARPWRVRFLRPTDA